MHETPLLAQALACLALLLLAEGWTRWRYRHIPGPLGWPLVSCTRCMQQ